MQDLPPVGGYEPVQWRRNLPSRGFRPIIYFWGVVGLCSFGFYKVVQANHENTELQREKLWSRFYLQPLLLAEEDRHIVRRFYADLEREKLILANNSDYKAGESVYNDGRYHKPAISFHTRD